jgi:hypothetical protein
MILNKVPLNRFIIKLPWMSYKHFLLILFIYLLPYHSAHSAIMLNTASSRNTTSLKSIPIAPSNLEVLETSFDYLLLIWEDNSDNEAFFVVERHIEGGNFEPFDTLFANTTLYIDYRVDAATKYYYRVLAYNLDGASGYSNIIDVVTLSLPHTPPRKPLSLHAYFYEGNSVILGWLDNSDNEMAFHLFRGDNLENFMPIDTINPNTTQYTDYSIEANHTYYYYIVASNDYGVSGPSDTASVVVTDINVRDSTRLRILFTTQTSVRLSWNKINLPDHDYSIMRMDGDSLTLLAEHLSDTVYSDSSLVPNTRYKYQVIANDLHDMQYYSNIAEAYTLPWIMQNRVNDSLVAIYFFANRLKDAIPDLSWYKEPANLFIADTNSIQFNSRNSMFIGRSNRLISNPETTLKIIEACQHTDEITIECWLKTSETIESPEIKIISLENESGTAFSLGCSEDIFDQGQLKYHTNLTTRTTDNFGNPELGMISPVNTNVLQHIVFTHELSGNEYMFLNGKNIAEGFRPSKFDNWDDSCNLVIANSILNDSPWFGALYMCAIYNRALTDGEIEKNYLASPFMEPEYTLNPTQMELTISPNPSSNELAIGVSYQDSAIDITEKYFIRIIDIHGVCTMEYDISSTFEGISNLLNISDLKQGIYSVILYNKHEIIARKKFLKI